MTISMSYIVYAICGVVFTVNICSIYFISKVWSYKEHPFIKSRSPKLSNSILWLFFSLSLLSILNTILYDITDFHLSSYFYFINDTTQILCTLSSATRTWLSYYHVKWSYESVNHVWRTQLLHVDIERKESDNAHKEPKLLRKSLFYMDNRDTLGNASVMYPIIMFIIVPLFIVVLDVLPLFLLNNYNFIIFRLVHIVFNLILFSIMFLWIYRIDKISDKYFIAGELFKTNLFFCLLFTASQILNIFGSNDIFIICISSCTMLSIVLAIFFGTCWVLHRFLTHNNKENIENSIVLRKILIVGQKKEANKELSKMSEHLSLNKVLSSKMGFEVFTQFLISNWAAENMLFLVEVKQYKACCRQYHKKDWTPQDEIEDSKEEFGDLEYAISLRPTTTTRSNPDVFDSRAIDNVDFVQSSYKLKEFKPYEYAMYLFNKYCKHGCDLQINISSKTYNQLVDSLINTTDPNTADAHYSEEMFKLYDKAWEEILYLIRGKFAQFKLTEECHQLITHQKQLNKQVSAAMMKNTAQLTSISEEQTQIM